MKVEDSPTGAEFSGNPRRIITLAGYIIVFQITLGYASSNGGAEFLSMPVSARLAALAQTGTAIAQGPDSISWNPANLARHSGGMRISHLSQFSEDTLDHLAVSIRTGERKNTALGLSGTWLAYAQQEGRDAQGQRTGSFEASDMAVGLALAHRWGPISGGTHLKMIRQEVAQARAGGYAIDTGFAMEVGRGLAIGAAVRNLGSKMSFYDASYDLPLTFSIGSAISLLNNGLAITVDAQSRPKQDQFSISMGTEYVPLKIITLRAGCLMKLASAVKNNQEKETKQGDFENFYGMTAGLGIKAGRIGIDYAFTPMGELGTTQIVTLGINW